MKSLRVIFISLVILLTACAENLTTEEYLQNGQQYLDKKEWKSAVIEFKNAIRQSPENARARVALGRTYLLTYSSDAALKELNQAVKLGYDKNSVLLDIGKAYEQKRDFESIINEIKVTSGQSAELQANIHALRANAFLQTGKMQSAKAELDSAKSLNENLTEVRLAWANYEKLSGNIEAQRKWLEPLLERTEGVADAWSQLGLIEQRVGNFEAAEEAFTKAIDYRKIVHLDYVSRAMIRIGKKNYDAAMQDINLLKKSGISWPVIGYAEALVAYLKGEYDLAQNILDKILSKYTDYMPAQLLMGLTQYEKGNSLKTVSHLEYFRSANPDNYQANLIYANSLLKLNKIPDAIEVLSTENLKTPDDYQVISMLGSAYIALKEYDKGIQLLGRAVELQPEEPGIRLKLGKALLSTKDNFVSGQQEIIKAIELNPELVQADLLLFSSYIKQKEFKKARKVAKEFSIRHTDSPLGFNLIGLSYLADKQPEKAVQQFKDALDKFPADVFSSHNLAKYYISENQLEQAKALYNKVLEKQPGHLKTLIELANIAAKQNDYKETIRLLKLAVQKNPESDSAKLLLAGQYIVHDNPNQANQVLQGVAESFKDDTEYLYLQASAKIGLKEYKHALTLLKKLVVKTPDAAKVYFSLGQVYLRLNQSQNARKALEKTQKLVPGNITSSTMLARLDLLEGKADAFKKRVTALYKKYPENKDVLLLYAKILKSNKDYKGAISILSRLKETTSHTEIVTDLASNQWVSGDRLAATKGLESWFKDHAEDTAVMSMLAQFYLEQSRNEEAKKLYLTLETNNPNNHILLNNLAWLMMDSDPVKGIEYGQRALKIAPESAAIKDTLAMLYLKQGNNQKALEFSQQATDKAKNNEGILHNYATILIANGKISQAKNVLQTLISKTFSLANKKLYQDKLNEL